MLTERAVEYNFSELIKIGFWAVDVTVIYDSFNYLGIVSDMMRAALSRKKVSVHLISLKYVF